MLKVSPRVNIAQRLKILLIRPKASEEVGRGGVEGGIAGRKEKSTHRGPDQEPWLWKY